MMSLPCRSSSRARFRTSNAVSVPSRDMRSANRSSNWRARDIRQNGLLYYLEAEPSSQSAKVSAELWESSLGLTYLLVETRRCFLQPRGEVIPDEFDIARHCEANG